MENPPRARGLAPEFAVAALLVVAAAPLFRLFMPGGLGAVVFFSIVLSLTVSWSARRMRVQPMLAWAASITLMVWFIAVRFFPHTLWGPFPSVETFRSVGPMIQQAIQQTVEEAAPVAPTAPLLMLVAAGVWATAWLADAAAFWVGNPLLAIGSTIPLFAVPGAITRGKHLWFDVALYLAAAAWVLFAGERIRAARMSRLPGGRAGWRAAPALRIALIACVVVVAASPLVPGYGGPPGFGGRGTGSGISFNPLVAIKPTLSRTQERVLLTIRTPLPTYLRLTALDRFDGDTFAPLESEDRIPIENGIVRNTTPASRAIVQTVQIQALAGPWLPAAYEAVALRSQSGLLGAVLEPSTGTVRLAAGGLIPGTTYDAVSRVPIVDATDLDRDFSYDEGALAEDLALPRVPATVRKIAERVAGAERTPYRKAVALQDYLRTFTYDLNVAAGSNYRTIEQFLTVSKRGYCEQFAVSMAVLARALGIPARVVIGFGFGSAIGQDTYKITTSEAHAWTEVFFPGYGWLGFEPTPRLGVTEVPAYAVPPKPATGSSSPTASPSASSSETAEPSASANPGGRQDLDPGISGGTGVAGGALRGVLILAGLVVLASIALAVVRVRRRRRWAHLPAREAVKGRYLDLLGWLAAAGIGRGAAETPAQYARRLAERAPASRDPLERWAAIATEALWAPPNGLNPSEFAEVSAAVQGALRPTLPRHARAMAALRIGPRAKLG